MPQRGEFYKNFSLVDSIAKKIGVNGATSTIFQLHQNRLIRISTNVKNKSGDRAIDSYIPQESIVNRTIREGKAYKGRAIVVGKWCVTHYEPLKNRQGDIVGAYYIGVPAPDTGLFEMINNTKIGERYTNL